MCRVFVSSADFEAILMPCCGRSDSKSLSLFLKEGEFRINGVRMASKSERQVRNTFEVRKLYFKLDIYLHNFVLRSMTFPYNSLYTQAYQRILSLIGKSVA